jgi:gliding motility-associated lipoprotein GldD
VFCALFSSCKQEVIPKPFAYLNLSFPEATYKISTAISQYNFEHSSKAGVESLRNDWSQINYPSLKATLVLTYVPVKRNLKLLISESDKLVFRHAKRADNIIGKTYVNKERKVYGRIYELLGDTASQIQFYVTDSTSNFVKGALYFNTIPNYDSILPAIAYLKKDILHLMETMSWKK